jgi:hypothetical protein
LDKVVVVPKIVVVVVVVEAAVAAAAAADEEKEYGLELVCIRVFMTSKGLVTSAETHAAMPAATQRCGKDGTVSTPPPRGC